jgi:hypothetical protein
MTLKICHMNKILLLAIIAILSFNAVAQDKKSKMKGRFDDVFEEEENNNLTLRFFNALTGDAVEGASVTVLGEEYASDFEGKVRFPNPGNDGYVKVGFECQGYIPSNFEIEVIAGTFFFNRISVSPKLDLQSVRIVLDWDNKPADLDAHFMKENGYHISYRNTRALSDGSAKLDRDDMDGYGPETITIRDIDDNGRYEFAVHDFTNRKDNSNTKLAKSKATVHVYAEGRLLDVFHVPQSGRGTKWSVFMIENGTFVKTNNIY